MLHTGKLGSGEQRLSVSLCVGGGGQVGVGVVGKLGWEDKLVTNNTLK